MRPTNSYANGMMVADAKNANDTSNQSRYNIIIIITIIIITALISDRLILEVMFM